MSKKYHSGAPNMQRGTDQWRASTWHTSLGPRIGYADWRFSWFSLLTRTKPRIHPQTKSKLHFSKLRQQVLMDTVKIRVWIEYLWNESQPCNRCANITVSTGHVFRSLLSRDYYCNVRGGPCTSLCVHLNNSTRLCPGLLIGSKLSRAKNTAWRVIRTHLWRRQPFQKNILTTWSRSKQEQR
jgi:hypothetical protein